MNGPIAQIVALTCHANAVLRGTAISPFLLGNSTCQFCDSVTFESPSWWGKQSRTVAQTPDEWFAHLSAGKATGVRLSWQSQNEHGIRDRRLAGLVGGGGEWTMEVLQPGGSSTFWTANWAVWNQNAPERRIWRVRYTGIKQHSSATPRSDLADAASRLKQVLERIAAFAGQHDTKVFVPVFDRAIRSLTTSERNGYHRDLAPIGTLPDQALALLDACQGAWVFSGMGSWNDTVFEGIDQAVYEEVSEELFNAVIEAIVAATNESCRVA